MVNGRKAAVKIADQVNEGLIERNAALLRIDGTGQQFIASEFAAATLAAHTAD